MQRYYDIIRLISSKKKKFLVHFFTTHIRFQRFR